MPGFTLAPALHLYAAFQRVSALRPLQRLVRTSEEKRRPRRIEAHAGGGEAQDRLLGAGGAGLHQRARIMREDGCGLVPTIVLGGFVPDATEQVFLLRRMLRRSGDIYYVNYSRTGFSLDLVLAQLADLVAELAARGQPPVLLGVSFGAGLVLEFLRRQRLAGAAAPLSGVILVSPAGCVADVMAAGRAKPDTLLGRAVQPYLGAEPPAASAIERSRTIFARMFEAGAQNKAALKVLMSPTELEQLRSAVLAAIREVSPTGAWERVAAFRAMPEPTAYFSPAILPLTEAPALVLFAEQEDGVLVAGAPTRFALETGLRAYFPTGRLGRVSALPGQPPVQHASLIFHVFEFLPPLQTFFGRLRAARLRRAA
ncbi:MAG: alpha/beta fold hydrolase [Verrucomicrobia bacterium]|nr:alpha/beta fold hydrolase [Verrucomicrobiota bacterium]